MTDERALRGLLEAISDNRGLNVIRDRAKAVESALAASAPHEASDALVMPYVERAAQMLAQQARGEAVWMFKSGERWYTFVNEQHRVDTIEDGRWEVRQFFTTPPAPDAAALELADRLQLHAVMQRRRRYPENAKLADEAAAMLRALTKPAKESSDEGR